MEASVRDLYSSTHTILIVGDGDFSFSYALSKILGGQHIVATSLDSRDTLLRSYADAAYHLSRLEEMGATVLHDIDCTTMSRHTDLSRRKYDRIVYNFPHAGFMGKESQPQVIRLHQKLVHGFLKQARRLIRQEGEIHISHKIKFPYSEWDLPGLGVRSGLFLYEKSDFRIEDFPGYKNKRGSGKCCDNSFHLGECCTFRFKLMNLKPRGERSLMRSQPPYSSMSSHHSSIPPSNFDLREWLNAQGDCMHEEESSGRGLPGT